MDVWELVRQIAIIVATLAAGGPGAVWLVDKIKGRFDLSGNVAFVVAASVSLLVAVAGLIVDGALSPDTVRIDNLSEVFLSVFFASQAYYRMVQRKREAADNEWIAMTADADEVGG